MNELSSYIALDFIEKLEVKQQISMFTREALKNKYDQVYCDIVPISIPLQA